MIQDINFPISFFFSGQCREAIQKQQMVKTIYIKTLVGFGLRFDRI